MPAVSPNNPCGKKARLGLASSACLRQVYFGTVPVYLSSLPPLPHTHTPCCASKSLLSLWIQISADNFATFYLCILVVVTYVTSSDLGLQATLLSLLAAEETEAQKNLRSWNSKWWNRVCTQRFPAAKALGLWFYSLVIPKIWSTGELSRAWGGARIWKAQTSAQPCVFSPAVIPGLVDTKIQFHQD